MAAADDTTRSFRARGVAELLGAVTRPAFRARSPATASLLSDWEAVVGPALAARTAPRRLAGGTLTIACDGPTAMELQHVSAAVLSRINTHAGHALVTGLRFVRGSVPASTRPAPRAAPRPPLEPIEGMAPGPLNDALAALRRSLK